MTKLQPSELFRYRASDFIVVYAETHIGFEITVKENNKAEFIGFYNVVGYNDALMTTYKFDTMDSPMPSVLTVRLPVQNSSFSTAAVTFRRLKRRRISTMRF